MKAVLSKEVGGPESLVLEEVSSPAYGKGQVLIRVKACGVNFPDSLMIKDMYQSSRRARSARAAKWPAMSSRSGRASPM